MHSVKISNILNVFTEFCSMHTMYGSSSYNHVWKSYEHLQLCSHRGSWYLCMPSNFGLQKGSTQHYE